MGAGTRATLLSRGPCLWERRPTQFLKILKTTGHLASALAPTLDTVAGEIVIDAISGLVTAQAPAPAVYIIPDASEPLAPLPPGGGGWGGGFGVGVRRNVKDWFLDVDEDVEIKVLHASLVYGPKTHPKVFIIDNLIGDEEPEEEEIILLALKHFGWLSSV